MTRYGCIINIILIFILAFAEKQVEAASPNNGFDPWQLFEYPSPGSHIRIDPSVLGPDDRFRITVSGEWFNVCVPRYQSHHIAGNVIEINVTAIFVGFCVPIEGPTSWSFSVEAGPLPVGLYTVEVYLVDSSPWGMPPILYDTTLFLVSTERLYLPLILRNQ